MARKSRRPAPRRHGAGGTNVRSQKGGAAIADGNGVRARLRDLWAQPVGRVGMAVAAAACVALVAVLGYIYGGGQPAPKRTGGVSPAATVTASKGQEVFILDPSGTEASFTIHEVLFGNGNTVVGKTNQVMGQIVVDPVDPPKTRVGIVRVDVSTLVTDNDMRNRTLQGRILETGDPSNQYATFVARSYQGLPATASALSVGKAFNFKVTGDLTLHQVTRSETFDVTVTPRSASALTGQATATVRYEDFGLVIPNVPFVADVSDSVVLTLSFTAHK